MYIFKAILIAFGGIFLLVVINALLSDTKAIQSKKISKPEQPACDAPLAKKLVHSMINDTHVFRRIKTTSQIPKVTVEDVWYTLDIEDKKAIDNGILCYLGDGFTSRVPLVEYLDPRTGKSVAMSGPRGFSMK